MSKFPDVDRLGISGRVLARCADEGRAALVGFLSLGYPSVEGSLAAFRALTDGVGCDLVEIGIPYSDPVLDGQVIQRANTKALSRGVRTADAFRAAEVVAGAGRTSVVMTYWNLVEQYGPDRFARDLAAAGGAGVITPDLTPDQAEEWIAATDAHGIDRIFLIAPSSSDERIAMTMAACRGWVYATSVMGVTGTRATTSDAAPIIAARARAADPGLPVGIGLGVSNADQAAEVAGYADAVIVGSALLKCLASDGADMAGDLDRLRGLVGQLAEGVRRRGPGS